MEAVLWYVLAGTPGGSNRLRVIRALDDRPRNANQLANHLDLDYKTVRHHLELLTDKSIITSSDHDYGAVYCPTDEARSHWDVIEDVMAQTDEPVPSSLPNASH